MLGWGALGYVEHSPAPFRTLTCPTHLPESEIRMKLRLALSPICSFWRFLSFVLRRGRTKRAPSTRFRTRRNLTAPAPLSMPRCLMPTITAISTSSLLPWDENVEFYHDQGGVTLGRAALTDSVKKNICGKVTRELVPGSLKVYHMKGYGMVEMGVHRFHHPGHDDTEGVGEGQFIHLWQYKTGHGKSHA